MDKAGFLSVVSIFSQMTARDLERMADHAQVQEYQKAVP